MRADVTGNTLSDTTMNVLLVYTFSSIGKKVLMAVSGAGLGLFLLIHLLGNATVFLGREAFVAYASHLHSLGALIPVAEFIFAIILLLHLTLGLILYIENLKVRPVRYHLSQEAGGRTLGSKTMPYTGLVVLAFLVVHLLSFRQPTQGAAGADLLRGTLRQPGMVLIYLFSFLALGLHTSHGFWSLFQSLGFNHPRYDRFLRRGAVLVSVVGGGVLMLIPLLAFFVDDFLL